MQRLLNEPTLIVGAVRAILLALAAFGFDLTGEEIAAFMLAVEAVLTLVNRSLVTPAQRAPLPTAPL
jgi:hypothetical protein